MVSKKRAGGLIGAVSAADREASLRALVVRLALEIELAGGQTLPPLARQLRDAMRELDSLPKKERNVVDEIAKKRDRRIAKADTP